MKETCNQCGRISRPPQKSISVDGNLSLAIWLCVCGSTLVAGTAKRKFKGTRLTEEQWREKEHKEYMSEWIDSLYGPL